MTSDFTTKLFYEWVRKPTSHSAYLVPDDVIDEEPDIIEVVENLEKTIEDVYSDFS